MRATLWLILFFLSTTPFAQESTAAEGLEIGNTAPAFVLRDLSRKNISLQEQKGKVILLNFWSTLCAPCTAEMPSLNSLYSAYKDKDFDVIAVAIDSSDKPVREFVLQKKIGFTILLDPDKEVFFDLYAGPSLPATYLIDRSGIIIEKFSGPQEWDSREFKNKIQKLLEKR